MLSLKRNQTTLTQWEIISISKTRLKDPQQLAKIPNKIMAIIKIQIMAEESLRRREDVAQTMQ